MADLSGLYNHHDYGEDDDEESLVCSDDMYDETLPPLERILKYSNSDIKENRCFLAKDLGNLAHSLGVEMTIAHILPVVHQLHDDADIAVREWIAEQLPILAKFIAEEGGPVSSTGQTWTALAVECTLPYALGMLTDHVRVRSTALESVVSLLPLLSQDQIDDEIFGVIEQLVGENTKEEYRMQALELIVNVSKHIAAEALGEASTKLVAYLQTLSIDSMFRVRKSVALHIGNMAKICGSTITSERILPLYLQLCSDEIWHVRKACAEVMMEISEVLPAKARLEVVPPLFFNFADDQIRWVRLSVYEILGQLIYTFRGQDATVLNRFSRAHGGYDPKRSTPGTPNPNTDYNPPTIPDEPSDASANLSFISSVYWNEPLADIDELVDDIDIEDHDSSAGGADKPTSTRVVALAITETKSGPSGSGSDEQPSAVGGTNHIEPTQGPITADASFTKGHGGNNTVPSGTIQPVDLIDAGPAVDERQLYHQVPRELTMRFVEMASEDLSRSVDAEIRLHCAYNFPAVVLTLGCKCWPTVRDAYITLCHDLDAKVRRTLAYSIHEVAQMLPVEDVMQDLVPLFNLFLKDIVHVRFGVMKNFAKFLSVLDKAIQDKYLDLITNIDDMEIVDDTDGASNWRFREVLANELVPISRLYDAKAVETLLFPLCLGLMQDSVAVVRTVAYKAVAEILWRMEVLDPETAETVAKKIKAHFTAGKSFRDRQMFVEICRYLCGAINKQTFASLFIPELIALASDPVPNVRLVVADVIASTARSHAEVMRGSDIEAATAQLRQDSEFDVRCHLIETQ